YTCKTHGTCCKQTAELEALSPRHDNSENTVQAAKHSLHVALMHADTLQVGHGQGPVNNFYQWW
ncbi:bifunctional hydroxymethylpyrimidine kinase/phosphomethylpyrimidine kinase, partial [Erwinia amylovora]|nr:bifunctional hydroxymethylpyrimidine kinase/phosphomethylpyrimidine kinase [Erwinia amylovora]